MFQLFLACFSKQRKRKQKMECLTNIRIGMKKHKFLHHCYGYITRMRHMEYIYNTTKTTNVLAKNPISA